jgi:stage V sporulation protein S
MPDLIKVSATSQTTAVAGAIAGIVRERRAVDVQAIGASAVNQAVKAIAIAHGYLEGDGLDIWCMPLFVQVEVAGLERTAVRFTVVVRGDPLPAELATPVAAPPVNAAEASESGDGLSPS